MNAKVLVIESDISLLENLSEILQLDGYTVYKAENGKKGIIEAKRLKPDLVMCSEHAEQLDGFGILKIMSDDDELSRIPIVFLSKKDCQHHFRKAMNLGADDYLSIPVDALELLQSVETRIKKSKCLQDNKVQDSINNIDSLFNIDNAKTKLKDLYKEDNIQHFTAKESIYHSGGVPHYFYWLKKGKIKTYMVNEDGKELITGLYGPGDFVGLIDLFGDHIYVENAKFVEDGSCLVISRKNFIQAISMDRDIAMYIYSKLNFSVNIRKERLLYMAYNSVRKRTADCLIWLCFVYNKEDKYPFHINFSREDLASLVGTAKESVIRALSNFKDEGLINTNSTELIIYDKEKLKNVIA